MAYLGPFHFESGGGPLHRLHPLSKLPALLLLAAAALAAAPGVVAVLLLLASGLLLADRVRPGDMAHNARFLLPFSLFVILVNIMRPGETVWLRPDGLVAAALYLLRISLVFLFAELFFRSTSIGELAGEATRLARRLPGLSRSDPGFYLSLSIGFLPRVVEAYARSNEAALARGLGAGRAARRPRSGDRALRGPGAARRFLARLMVLESFIAEALRSALRTAAALEARCYSPDRSIPRRPMRPRDALPPLVGAAALFLAFRIGY
ncbi:MAG TPA: energy-coupling factor transporter transmembrane component T [Rectinemataceae bacterium]|nr:energy-coupling factor transporter transmembrane component T [Rectinemataceae bacterium]